MNLTGEGKLADYNSQKVMRRKWVKSFSLIAVPVMESLYSFSEMVLRLEISKGVKYLGNHLIKIECKYWINILRLSWPTIPCLFFMLSLGSMYLTKVYLYDFISVSFVFVVPFPLLNQIFTDSISVIIVFP